MIEQLLAMLQQNPDAAAMQLAASGIQPPKMPNGMAAPMPTPRPEGIAGAVAPGMGDLAKQEQMMAIMKALGAVQSPEPPRTPGASVQGGNSGFVPGYAPNTNTAQVLAGGMGQPMQPGGLAAALMGRR